MATSIGKVSFFGKPNIYQSFKMPLRTLTQMATCQTSIFAMCYVFLTTKDKCMCIGKIYSNEELFESGLCSCSLMALNSDLYIRLGILNVA